MTIFDFTAATCFKLGTGTYFGSDNRWLSPITRWLSPITTDMRALGQFIGASQALGPLIGTIGGLVGLVALIRGC